VSHRHSNRSEKRVRIRVSRVEESAEIQLRRRSKYGGGQFGSRKFGEVRYLRSILRLPFVLDDLHPRHWTLRSVFREHASVVHYGRFVPERGERRRVPEVFL